MFGFLNCCSHGANVKEPRAQIVKIRLQPEPETRLLSAKPEEFGDCDFVFEWLMESIKNIEKEIAILEKKAQTKSGENFLLFRRQTQLLEDVKTFIIGESEDNYRSAVIRLELATGKPATELKEMAKTPPMQEYNFR